MYVLIFSDGGERLGKRETQMMVVWVQKESFSERRPRGKPQPAEPGGLRLVVLVAQGGGRVFSSLGCPDLPETQRAR